ncbi:glyoxalase [cyanobacterium TDX16]|nr:glyoxalase [cyanobacterium TDX16]
MIENISLVTVWVHDKEEAKAFYLDVLGFEERVDVAMGDGFRWVTVGHPSQPELEVTLMEPGPPLDDDLADAIRRALGKGTMTSLGLKVDDCTKAHEDLVAKGVDFVQEPSDRPYGVEAVMRDNSGNWLVLVEPRPYEGGDFPPA